MELEEQKTVENVPETTERMQVTEDETASLLSTSSESENEDILMKDEIDTLADLSNVPPKSAHEISVPVLFLLFISRNFRKLSPLKILMCLKTVI